MWDPRTYPELNIIADIGQNPNASVRYLKGDIYMEHLVGSGILRRNQLDDQADGPPARFFQSRGGSPSRVRHLRAVPLQPRPRLGSRAQVRPGQRHRLPVLPPNALSIRAADKDKLAPCLKKLVPIVQRAQIDFLNHPTKTNALIDPSIGVTAS